MGNMHLLVFLLQNARQRPTPADATPANATPVDVDLTSIHLDLATSEVRMCNFLRIVIRLKLNSCLPTRHKSTQLNWQLG
jgi:acetolactate synthase small subunit